MPAATPLVRHHASGQLVSHLSKSGMSECSSAASALALRKATSATQKVLAKCRAAAKQNGAAKRKQASGKVAPGRDTFQRHEQAAALKSTHAERVAAKAATVRATPEPKPRIGSTGAVERKGDHFYKNSVNKLGQETQEGAVYRDLRGVTGIAGGESDNGKIKVPAYKNVLSTDDVPAAQRRGFAPMVGKNADRINRAISALSAAGYSYNDPLQFGVGEGHALDLLDFSNASKESPDEALDQNAGHLMSFYHEFGRPDLAAAVYDGLHVMKGAKDPDAVALMDDPIRLAAEKVRGGIKGEPRAVYYTNNAREIGIGGAVSTGMVNGRRYVVSDKPIDPAVAAKWELHPLVEARGMPSKPATTTPPGGFSLRPAGAASKPVTPSMFGRPAETPKAETAPKAAPAPTPAPRMPGPKPEASPFGLRQESAAGRKAPGGFFDAGAGRTGTMFDMKKGDLPGQTSLLEQVPSVDTRPKAKAEGRGTPERLKQATEKKLFRSVRAEQDQLRSQAAAERQGRDEEAKDSHAKELERRAKIGAMPPAERMKHAFDPATNNLNVGGDQLNRWLKDATPADMDAVGNWIETLPIGNRGAARRWIGGAMAGEKRRREQQAEAKPADSKTMPIGTVSPSESAPKSVSTASTLPGGTRPELTPAQIEQAVAEHRAERAKGEPVRTVGSVNSSPPVPKTPLTSAQRRAAVGGEVGMNGEHYRAGAFIANTPLAKMTKAERGQGQGTGRREVAPGQWEAPPGPGLVSLFANTAGSIGRVDHATGKIHLDASDQTLRHYGLDRERAQAQVDRYNAGERWVKAKTLEPHTPTAPRQSLSDMQAQWEAKPPRADRLAKLAGRIQRHREALANKASTPGNPLHQKNMEVFGRGRQLGELGRKVGEELGKSIREISPRGENKASLPPGHSFTDAHYESDPGVMKHHYILKNGQKEVGEIAFVPRKQGGFEVSNAQVWPESQRKGHGTRLYEHAANEAAKLGGKLHISDDRTTAAKALHADFEKKGILKPDGSIDFGSRTPAISPRGENEAPGKPDLKAQVDAHRAATWSADPAERKTLAENRKIDRRTLSRGRILAGSGEFSHRSPDLGARPGDQVSHEEDRSLHGTVVGRDAKNADLLTVRRPDGHEFKALRNQLVLPRERLADRYSPARQAKAAEIKAGRKAAAPSLREQADAAALRAREVPHTPGTPNPAKRELVNRAKEANHAANQEAAKGARSVVLKSDEPTGVNTMMVHPSTREPGRHQLSRIDHEGNPVGHGTFDTKEQAIASASGMHVGNEPPHGHSGFKVTETAGREAPPKPSLREQAEAHRAAKGAPGDRIERLAERLEPKLSMTQERADRRLAGLKRVVRAAAPLERLDIGRVTAHAAKEIDANQRGNALEAREAQESQARRFSPAPKDRDKALAVAKQLADEQGQARAAVAKKAETRADPAKRIESLLNTNAARFADAERRLGAIPERHARKRAAAQGDVRATMQRSKRLHQMRREIAGTQDGATAPPAPKAPGRGSDARAELARKLKFDRKKVAGDRGKLHSVNEQRLFRRHIERAEQKAGRPLTFGERHGAGNEASQATRDRAARSQAGTGAAKPKPAVTRPGDPADRQARATQIRAERAEGNHGTARDLRERPLNYDRVRAEKTANRVKRAEKNVAMVKDYLAKGGTAWARTMTKATPYRHPDTVVGVDKDGAIRILTGRSGKSVSLGHGPESAYFTRDARMAKADELKAKRAPASPR